MSLVAVVLVAALLLGWARGGSLDQLGRLLLRRRRLVVAAVLAQLAGTVVGGPFYALGLIISTVLILAFLFRNRVVAGTGLVAAGLFANMLVVGANGAMPVSADAAGRAGVSVQSLLTGAGSRHVLSTESTRLRWLADIVPVPLPQRPEVVSAGDVLIAAGLGQLVALGMLGAGAMTAGALTAGATASAAADADRRQERPTRRPALRRPAARSSRRVPLLRGRDASEPS